MTAKKVSRRAIRLKPAKTARARRAVPKRRDDYAVNAAIRAIAEAEGLSARQLARMLYVDIETVWYWGRSKPSKAPKMALALLCEKLGKPYPSVLMVGDSASR